MLSRRALIVPMLGGMLLAACGFQLRGSTELPFQRIAMQGFAPRSPLAEELRKTLAQSAEVVATPAQAQVVLHALSDRRERGVVASTTAAQVRELQLRVRLEFKLTTPGGRELIPATELLLTRDMSYSETVALAKEYEEEQLLRAMQSDIIGQLMRRLAHVKGVTG
jgi:LPS-assembly lipoprotein